MRIQWRTRPKNRIYFLRPPPSRYLRTTIMNHGRRFESKSFSSPQSPVKRFIPGYFPELPRHFKYRLSDVDTKIFEFQKEVSLIETERNKFKRNVIQLIALVNARKVSARKQRSLTPYCEYLIGWLPLIACLLTCVSTHGSFLSKLLLNLKLLLLNINIINYYY